MNANDCHHNALLAVQSGLDDDALKYFESAVNIEPLNTAIRLDYARFLACLFRFDEALAHADQARLTRPDMAAVARAAAGIATTCRNPAIALAWLGLHSGQAACHYDAAVLLERDNKIEESAEQLRMAEKCGGPTVDGKLLSAKLSSRMGKYSESLETLDKLLGSAPDRPALIAKIHYARGHALDHLGEYDDAFSAWSKAKNLLKPMAGNLLADSNRDLAALVGVIHKITPQILSEWREEMPMNSGPQVLLLTGFVRSGTTLLERLLLRGRSIVSADENTAFRDMLYRHMQLDGTHIAGLWRGLKDFDTATLRPQRAGYDRALIALSGGTSRIPWIIEKNPQLLPALPIMLRVMPHLKVLAIQRHPLDVMISCFSQDFGLNHHSIHFLTLADTAKRIVEVREFSQSVAEIMGSSMFVTQYASLVDNTTREVERIAQHFGIATDDTPALDQGRPSYSPSYAEVAKPVTKEALGRWKNYSKHVEAFVEMDEMGD